MRPWYWFLIIGAVVLVANGTIFNFSQVKASHCEGEPAGYCGDFCSDIQGSEYYDQCVSTCHTYWQQVYQECVANEAGQPEPTLKQQPESTIPQPKKIPPTESQPAPKFNYKSYNVSDLQEGQTINIGKGEKAILTFADGSYYRFDENSTFVFGGIQKEEITLKLLSGKLRGWVERLVGRRLKVATGNAITSIRGTDFEVIASPTLTEVNVFQGVVEVSDLANRKTVEVAAGNTVSVPKDGLPSDPSPFDPTKLIRWYEDIQIPTPTKPAPWFSIISISAVVGLLVGFIILLLRLILMLFRDLWRKSRHKEVFDKDGKKMTGSEALKKNLIDNLLRLGIVAVAIVVLSFIFYYNRER